jgi:hypothetical protein
MTQFSHDFSVRWIGSLYLVVMVVTSSAFKAPNSASLPRQPFDAANTATGRQGRLNRQHNQ